MGKIREVWKESWENAFYRATMCYIATLVTIIFSLQMREYFFNSSNTDCGQGPPSVSKLVPVVGVQFDAES